jgi:hypothetical protein
MGDIVNAVADVFGFGPASKQADATEAAANTSAAATREGIDLQRRIYEENIKRQQPFLDIGTNALNRLVSLNQPGADVTNFLTMDPGYNFRLGEGMKALERSAAARGGLVSGATGKALTRYGQDFGSAEFGNAYNRLANIANLGPKAAGVMTDLGTGYAGDVNKLALANATNQGNALLSAGNIRASQYGTAGRALDQALNTDWGKVGDTVGGWFGGGSSAPASSEAVWI